MLESLLITNFQPHEKELIEFDPLVTTITADRNDAGKSAVLRCLRWVCTNKSPKGDFIRWGSETARGKLKVDGHTIVRKKGKSDNVYILDGDRLEAPGKGDPPEPVSKILNIGPQNWQKQLDDPFWFLETPGAVSRELNKIVNLELIDKTLGNISSKLRRKRTEESICQQRLEVARERRNELAWVLEMDEELCILEQKYTKIQEIAKNRARIVSVLEQVESTKKSITSVSTLSQAGLQAIAAGSLVLEVGNRCKKLKEVLQSIKNTNDNRIGWQIKRKQLEIGLEEKMGGRCPICDKPILETKTR